MAKEVRNPDTTYWATNNYIAVSGGPWLQLMSVGAEPAPSFAALTLSSGGARPYVASVSIIQMSFKILVVTGSVYAIDH